MKELENAINNLEKELYKTTDIDKINDKDLEKPLFELLKNCIKTGNHEVKVGNYKININPRRLLVSYDTIDTFLEISNEDNYTELARSLPVKYYQIIGTNNALVVTSEVVTVDNYITHNFFVELKSEELDIKDYVINANAYQDNNAFISIDVKKDDKVKDIETYLNMDKLTLVKYIPSTNTFEKIEKIDNNNDYKELSPDQTVRREILKSLYKYLINFYKSYLENNSVRTN
ncbi:MAG: hypothetical protein ACI4WW_01720 [Candidatus Coprovivens sp.]